MGWDKRLLHERWLFHHFLAIDDIHATLQTFQFAARYLSAIEVVDAYGLDAR